MALLYQTYSKLLNLTDSQIRSIEFIPELTDTHGQAHGVV